MNKLELMEIRGLCSLYAKEFKSDTGRNPKTGVNIKNKPQKITFFKAGNELKVRVNRYVGGVYVLLFKFAFKMILMYTTVCTHI
jgi:hypothetical protein